ncbi:MAG: TRAP transporter substrate-binding protein DctP [Rhodospirillales bacterium]|nr:TRAP transporter substrate-binding protein DctP [Rhodospirillales bacterium]
MFKKIKIIKFWVIILMAAFIAPDALPAENLPLLRISTENSAEHVQTRVVQLFADRLAEKLKDSLRVELHHSARLFRDSNVVDAIGEGKVEMAVPGTWQLDRYEPNIGIFLLPMFYGREADVNYELHDGEIGQAINLKIAETLKVKVLGRWIDLGFAHLYGVKHKINRHEDISGMQIRSPGGEANGLRLEALGAIPRIIPWPDLPQALDHGTVDGVLTTHATVVSARLWERGIRYAFEDKEYFPQYVPLMSEKFWTRLSPETQQIISETWESVVDEGRLMAAEAQKEASQTLKDNGVQIVVPSSDELARWREQMISKQPGLIEKMGINPELATAVMSKLSEKDGTAQ